MVHLVVDFNFYDMKLELVLVAASKLLIDFNVL